MNHQISQKYWIGEAANLSSLKTKIKENHKIQNFVLFSFSLLSRKPNGVGVYEMHGEKDTNNLSALMMSFSGSEPIEE